MDKILERYYFGYTSYLPQSAQWVWHTVVAVVLAGAALGLSKLLGPNSRTVPLPPGPEDAWYSPGPKAALKYEQLTKTYGPVFSYKQGKKVTVVVGRHQAAVDIMQKHGSDVADRPRNIAVGEIFSGGMRTLLIPAGEQLQKLRKALYSKLRPSVVPNHLPMQWKFARGLVLDILNDPGKHIEHARNVIVTMTYGKTTPTQYSDPEIQAVVKSGLAIGKLLASPHIVDDYPILRYVPWVTAELREGHKYDLDLYTSQVDNVRRQVEAGTAQQSFITYLLENQQAFGLSDAELAYLGGSMFGAGSETTASAISFAVMAAAKFPEEQAKVQAQLDSVLGHDRVPSYEDESSLPRVTAFYMEVFRWRPVSWGGFAHRATNDIIWNNYVIPAGATVIGSHWCISHDPEVYPDPESFKPDRWLNEKGQLRDDLTYCNYGFGRRVCPGQFVANNSLFLTVALMFWAFKISEEPSAPIDTMAFLDSANTRPIPFKANFETRIKDVKDIVETSLAQA